MAKRKTPRRKPRTKLVRDKATKKPGRIILIVCEGEKTEPKYFQSLRGYFNLRSVEIEIVGKECGAAPISVVDEALEREKKRRDQSKSSDLLSYDEVWCVFDTEDPNKNPSLHKAINKLGQKQKDARKRKTHDSTEFRRAMSRPCFEFWYVLHFERNERPHLRCGELIRDELKRFVSPYGKGVDVFPKIVNFTQDAIARARTVLENHVDYDGREDGMLPNPSTEVYKLVDHLHELSE